MLYAFYGTDTNKSHGKAKVFVDSLRAKRPDATFVTVDANAWSPSVVSENAGGQGLFSSKYIIYLDRIGEKKDNVDTLVEVFSIMKDSENIFVILEGKVNADMKKAIEKHSDKTVVTDIAEVKGFAKNADFNIFSLADAVGERNAFRSWSIYRTAVEKGLEPESIVGTLFWQVKSMIVAAGAKSASESGLSPFVFSKAKKASEKYSEKERGELLKNLITIYHDGHRGTGDIEVAVEKLLLSIQESK